MQQMLRFVFCDSSVTPEMKGKVTELFQQNIPRLQDNKAALFLQQLLINTFQKLWAVIILRDAGDINYKLVSNVKITMDIEIEGTRFILIQFEEYSDCLQKDKFIKTCQTIEKQMNEHPDSLANYLQDAYQHLEELYGAGTQILFYQSRLGDFSTVTQYEIPSTIKYQFQILIDEDAESYTYISAIIFYQAPFNSFEDSQTKKEFQDIQHSYNDQDDYEQYQQHINDQDLIHDEYEEPMDTLFQVMLEEKEFRQSTDQVKVSFDELEIQPLKVHSFAIIFYMIVSPFPKDIKDDLNVISTGSSLMSKNLTFGINKDQLLFLNFQLLTGKMETLYSQMKVKRNQQYQIAIVYTESDYCKEVSIYVNGTIENQINLSQGIEPPRGYFWIGSEQALKLFKGSLRDIVFISTALSQKHFKTVYAEFQGAQNHHFQKHTIEIIQEVMEQLKDEVPVEQDESKYTVAQSMLTTKKSQLPKSSTKKLQIPIQLQKSFQVFEDDNKKQKGNQQGQLQQQQRSIRDYAIMLKQEFQQNEELHHKCHELSINFFWVFTTLSQLAPPLEENSNPKLPFDYLHSEICKERFENYPVYAIEFERFSKVVQYGGIHLSNDDIYKLACAIECIKHNKVYGHYIFYDKFLLVVREAALSEQEIEMVQSQYNFDEKDVDQDLIIQVNGIQKQKQPLEHNFSFFQQLVVSVGSEQEACKYNLQYLYAYFVQDANYVQKLTAMYVHKETNQELEIEGIDFYSYNEDKVFRQKLDISEESDPKYFRVHYKADHMAMIAFKTHKAEETFQLDRNFTYKQGEDATGYLETYAFEGQRLAGFRGTLRESEEGQTYLFMLQAEYLIKDPKVEEMRKSQPETLPTLNEQWNQGKFQLIINRCSECDKHSTTTWHDEADFALKFNELGQILKDLFPNIDIIGNWDKTQQLEHFDVYVRGIGPQGMSDREGRYFLFRKKETVRSFLDHFLSRALTIYDKLVLMAQAYGDTNEMAKRQEQFLKSQQYPPRSKQSQDFPCTVPDRPEKGEGEEVAQTGVDYICKNWGCGQIFKFESNQNGIKKCKHHPGRYEFGSKHGLWPECWTCCGKPWESEGCKLEMHRGVPEKDHFKVCCNVGPVDSKSGYPEGICGMKFQEGDGNECKYNGGTHQTAQWPDPKAKVYFLQKLHINPALKEKDQKLVALKPDMFRETKPYHEFINKDRQKLMKLIDTENEIRQCTNWTCGKQYKEIDNRKRRMCKCHPGVFDFGHTASTIQEAVEQYKQDKGSKILWRPHWTCCRKSWTEPGCTLMQHNGPLQSEYKPRQYQWPDENAQIYFKKKVSENWQRMLSNNYQLTPEMASLKYDKLCSALGSGGVISVYKLAELCDKFNMHLWVCSEDLSFQFKFSDIVDGKAQDYLNDNHGNIDKHKFLDWWFADVNRFLEISNKK